MTNKFTPGPWKVSTYANGTMAINTDVLPYPRPQEEANANARLIAAAPELLAALEELTEQADEEFSGGLGYLIDAARQAIAKAYGE